MPSRILFSPFKPYFFLLQVKTEQASQFCERVATRRTVKSLETEIIQKTKRIQTEERKYEHCTFPCLIFIAFLFHVLLLPLLLVVLALFTSHFLYKDVFLFPQDYLVSFKSVVTKCKRGLWYVFISSKFFLIGRVCMSSSENRNCSAVSDPFSNSRFSALRECQFIWRLCQGRSIFKS